MKNNTKLKDKINLLWTGGWDSTFQLLQLLIVYRNCVVPYYIIDTERKSIHIEIQTMKRIKDKLFTEYPFTRELLQPTRFYSVSDILPDPKISMAYQSILKNRHLGLQYEWIARFCKEHSISNMQLSIQKHIKPNKASLSDQPIFTISTDGLRDVYIIDSKFKKKDEYVLFRYFCFPIINTSKLQMAAISKKNGWDMIMLKTWFCHNPTCNIKPCGKCKPCLIAIKENFGWRIPYIRRIISLYYTLIYWPLKNKVKTIIKTP
jgi:hypothetical protein